MVCCGYLCVRFSLLFGAAFGAAFHFVFCVLWPRAKKAEERNSTHSPRENLFFQGARPRRRSPKDDNRRPKKALHKGSTKCKTHQTSLIFQPPGADLQKYHPKGPPVDPTGSPGDPQTAPRGAKSAPRAPQDGSKSRQERSKSQGRLRRGLAATWGRPRAQRPPGGHLGSPRGSILAPPGVHVGASGEQKKGRRKSKNKR